MWSPMDTGQQRDCIILEGKYETSNPKITTISQT